MINESNENKGKSKKSKLGTLLVILLVGISAKVFGGYLYASYNKSNKHDDFMSSVYKSVDLTKNELPMQVDEYTTWEEINFDGSTMLYSYTVELPDLENNDRDALISEVRKNNTKPICESPEIAIILNNGIEYRYVYNDSNKTRIGSYVVTREICNDL